MDGRTDGRIAKENANKVCFPSAVCCECGMNLYAIEVSIGIHLFCRFYYFFLGLRTVATQEISQNLIFF
jgi:hypothetical protein